MFNISFSFRLLLVALFNSIVLAVNFGNGIEIVYETEKPELNVKTSRLIIGERNQVAVEVANRTAQPLRGKLRLTASKPFQRDELTLDVELKAREVKLFHFDLPVSAEAVGDDRVVLRAVLDAGTAGSFSSPSVTAEIAPRFSWRIFPATPGAKLTWPLRPGTQQTIDPPLIYPSDDNATEAKFNLRFTNNTAQDITLMRNSLLVNSLPLKLRPDEEYLSTYTYNFAPGTKSVLNPFAVTISEGNDGQLTETARVNCVALRKGEAVAFAYDIDRDGFEDYVLENEHLRLVISPNAGAHAFALINKHTDVNAFTSVGGLRDIFAEFDAADPTRNARFKRGVHEMFNRPYTVEIVEGMGKRVTVRTTCDAPDIFLATEPSGVRIERIVVLNARDEFFTADYRITPNAGTVNGRQAFWSTNSVVVGDPNLKARRFVAADGGFEFVTAKTRALDVQSGCVTAPVADRAVFAVLWRGKEVSAAEVEMKGFSSLLNLKFKPFANADAHSYRLVFYFGAMSPPQIIASRARMIGE